MHSFSLFRPSLLVVLLGITTTWAKTDFDSTASICSISKACLGNTPSFCSPEQSKPNPEIKYDLSFCDEAKTLAGDGLGPEQTTAKVAWSKLGRPLRVEFEESGLLPLRFEAVEYLLKHFPLAMELINAYRNTKYSAEYRSPDSSKFHGSNGKNLRGEFRFLTSRSSNGHHVMYGMGSADMPGPISILFGKGNKRVSLGGDALLFWDAKPRNQDKCTWQMRVLVFNEENFMSKVMGMDVFRRKVGEYMQEIISDISKAAQEYAKGNRNPIQNSPKLNSGELALQLQEFERLLKVPPTDSGAGR